LPLWGRLAATILTVAIAVAGMERAARSYRISTELRELGSLTDQARASETEGRVGDALAELEAALAMAGEMRPPPPGLDDLRRWRADLSVRDTRARLAAVEAAGDRIKPPLAVGEAMTLLALAERDEALTGLVPSIRATLEKQLERWTVADAVEARRALDAGQDARALDLCRRMYDSAQDLPTPSRKRVEAEAAGLAGEAISRSGTIIEPVRGTFTLGTPSSYSQPVLEPLNEALRRQGFVPRPPKSPWDDLWESRSPFRVTLEVDERQNGAYLESPNRVSRIEARMEIRRGDVVVWTDRSQGRTQVPLPKAPAYMASRLAVSARRSAEFERMLYENARDAVSERVRNALLSLPESPSRRAATATAGAL